MGCVRQLVAKKEVAHDHDLALHSVKKGTVDDGQKGGRLADAGGCTTRENSHDC